ELERQALRVGEPLDLEDGPHRPLPQGENHPVARVEPIAGSGPCDGHRSTDAREGIPELARALGDLVTELALEEGFAAGALAGDGLLLRLDDALLPVGAARGDV